MFKLIIFLLFSLFLYFTIRSFYRVVTGHSKRLSKKPGEIQKRAERTDLEVSFEDTLGDVGEGIAETFSEVGEILGDATLNVKDTYDKKKNDPDKKVAGSIGRTLGVTTFRVGKTLISSVFGGLSKAGQKTANYLEKK